MANSRSLQQAVRFALAAVSAAAAVPTVSAQEAPAATPAAPLQEVVVTGSRLLTPNETSISPIATLSAQEIQQSGLTRVEDVLGNMPQVAIGQNSTVSNGADGTATIALRGLGQQRTLVLVDGLRLGPGSAVGGRNYSDLNQIPAALIDKVDVLTGGASAVYGADAVAGVVNFILNTHFDGIKVEAGYNFYQHNNDNQAGTAPLVTQQGIGLPPSNVDTGFGKFASVVMGSNFADNKGNATAYVTYDNQGATLQKSFDYSVCNLAPASATALACSGSPTSAKNGAGGHFYAYSSAGAFGNIFDKTVTGSPGKFVPFQSPQDLFNYAPYNYYLTPNERWTAGAFVNYDLNSHVNVYTQVMWMRNHQDAQIAPSGAFFVAGFVACDNPLLSASERAAICTPANLASQGNPYETYDNGNGVKNHPGLNMYVLRRNVEGGPRIADFITNSAREVIGVKGDFGDSRDAWTYDFHAQHGTVDNNNQNQNYLSNSAISQAINALPGPGGTAVCGGPSKADGTGPLVAPGTGFTPNPACVPWNVWNANAITPAQTAFLSVPLLQEGSVTEYVVNGSVTGDIGKYGVKTPWADSGLRMNVGAEWRQETSNYLPDYLTQQGSAAGSGGPTPPIFGAFHVKEGFTELRLPIAEKQFLAQDLNVNGAYRYSDYSEGFTTHTWAAGLEWQPVQDIRIRGGYQRAVRAPNIGELYSPQAVNLDGSVDPCAGPAVGGLVNGNTFAQCAKTGVTQTQFGNIKPNPANQYNGKLGGNPNLAPEEADTYTIGWIATPRWVPNLTVGSDYFNIRIKQTIGIIGSNTILNDCITSGTLCGQIHRDNRGSLWQTPSGYVVDTNQNTGSLQTEGIDVHASYTVSMKGLGSLLFMLEGTKTKELVTQPVTNGPTYDCVGYYGATCGPGTPKWRSVFSTTWSTPWAGLDVTARWRYYGTTTSELTSSNPLLQGSPFLPLAHIPAYSYFDLSGVFNVYKNVRLELGVNNITDKVPPLVVGADCSTSSPNGANCNGNTFPGYYDAMGRYIFSRITAQF